jgi:hypothetical protein
MAASRVDSDQTAALQFDNLVCPAAGEYAAKEKL